MATINLTDDTLISTLMPSGGGSLASGDTIQLAGHSLIVDVDAVDYPVIIANSGADANLELRDGGRIKLNQAGGSGLNAYALSTSVHPYVAPANPLPVAAGPGIDGDLFRTSLTANARAEIQLNGTIQLGGGAASLPTSTRNGAFYGRVESVSGSTITFEEPFPLHVGDLLYNIMVYAAFQQCAVTSVIDERTVTVDPAPSRTTVGDVWVLAAGGVCINRLVQTVTSMISTDFSAGTAVLLGPATAINNASDAFFFNAHVVVKRLACFPSTTVSGNGFAIAPCNGSIDAYEVACGRLFRSDTANSTRAEPVGYVRIGHLACCCYSYDDSGGCATAADVFVGGGISVYSQYPQNIGGYGVHRVRGMDFAQVPTVVTKSSAIEFQNCTNGANTLNGISEMAGTITPSHGAWYHAPATAADVTWRHADRLVFAGATLRFRCAWRREGSTATRASVAVADPATWWPQLWTLGAEAMASVEMGESGEEDLVWTNNEEEDAQVRVWECVTGDVLGGYLSAREPDESESESESGSESQSGSASESRSESKSDSESESQSQSESGSESDSSSSGGGGGGDAKGIVGRALQNAQDGISSYTHGNRSISRNSPESTLNFADRYEERQKRKKGRMPWMNVGF